MEPDCLPCASASLDNDKGQQLGKHPTSALLPSALHQLQDEVMIKDETISLLQCQMDVIGRKLKVTDLENAMLNKEIEASQDMERARLGIDNFLFSARAH